MGAKEECGEEEDPMQQVGFRKVERTEKFPIEPWTSLIFIKRCYVFNCVPQMYTLKS